jgi:UDP-N-acetyl-D-glucosamine dehydrogenase
MKVAIIGQGYVGLTISAFAGAEHDVVGFDNSPRIVELLNKGISHIEGVDSAVIAKWASEGRYRATVDGADIKGADIVVIAVPTPLTKDRKPDMSFIEAACKTIAENIDKPVLIINESTSFPGTVRNFIKPLIEKLSAQKFKPSLG